MGAVLHLLYGYDMEAIHALDAAIVHKNHIGIKSKVGRVFHFFDVVFIKDWSISIETIGAQEREAGFLHSPILNMRRDYQDAIGKVEYLVENFDRIYLKEIKKFSFIWWIKHFKECLMGLQYAMKNYKSFFERMLFWEKLISMAKLLEKMDCQIWEKYKIVTSFYDVYAPECLGIQFFNKKGIPTASLQHGAFIAKRVSESDQPHYSFLGQALQYSRSDFFLAWNHFTEKEAIQSGMNPSKIKVVGIPKYIGKVTAKLPSDEELNFKNGIFGVVLNLDGYLKSNYTLLKIADSLAQGLHMRYGIRFHPTSNMELYDNYAGRAMSPMSVEQYADKVDFTLILDSSVLVELAFLKKPVYHFHVKGDDIFENLLINKFSTYEECLKLICEGKTNNDLLWIELCSVLDVKKEYGSFYEMVLGHSL